MVRLLDSRGVVVRMLVIEHEKNGGAEAVGAHLVSLGFELEPFLVTNGDRFPDPSQYDAILVMGASPSLYDHEAVGSWIGLEIDLVKRSLHDDQPVLGICFGAQVLSTALGGTVSRARSAEHGWHHIESTVPEIASGPWFQWHIDTFTVPDEAKQLGTTANAPQAFRHGRTLGIQFHPEVSSSLISTWLGMGGRAELEKHGVDPDQILADTEANETGAHRRAGELVDWWLADIARIG